MELIYLDNNATTRVDQRVVQAMLPYLETLYGNPSSAHRLGQESRRAIDQARSSVAELTGAGAAEIVFTSGGTESINTAIGGLCRARAPRRRIITSTVEHSATREVCRMLQLEGWEVIEIPVDGQGLLDLDRLRAEVDERTALASMLWVNNETGVILQVPQIAEICRAAGAPFHCDATQALGRIPVDFRATGVDAASFSAHKFHGPKGVGGLYVRRGVRMGTMIVGGPQERNRRGGTENVPGIVGMGKAAELAQQHLADMPRVAALRDQLETGVLRGIPGTAAIGSPAHRVPNTANIGFARLEAEAILLLLSERGVCASAGAACASGSLEASHVLKAMNVDPVLAHGAVRFSLSRFTTEAEIEQTLQILPAVIEKLRRVLPVSA